MKTLSKPTEKSDNELIAEFMGLKFLRNERGVLASKGHNAVLIPIYEVNGLEVMDFQMKYNTSWDWLMPVVEKINMVACGKYNSRGNVLRADIHGDVTNVIIKEAHKNVVEFIKWYNLNQITPKP